MKTETALRAGCVGLAVAALAAAGPGAADEAADSAAWMKDLLPIQIPIAKLKPEPETTGGLGVSLAFDRPDGRYSQGDSVELTVEATEDSYIWVFDTGTSGKVHQIFPNRYETENFVSAGTPVAIPGPDATYEFAVSYPPGNELLTVVASRDETLLVDLLDGAGDAGPFAALRGNADSVAKDIVVTVREKQTPWVTHNRILYIE